MQSAHTFLNTFGLCDLLGNICGGNFQESTLILSIECIVIIQTECISMILANHINAQINAILQMLTILAALLFAWHIQNALVIETDHFADFLVVIEFQFGRWSKNVKIDAHAFGNFIDSLCTEQLNL